MTPRPARELKAAFEDLVTLRAEAREVRLERLRRTDPRLHEELRELLAADGRAEEVLEVFESPGWPGEAAGRAGVGKAREEDLAELAARISRASGGRYELQRRLGRGGMATVYLATDTRHDRPVAIKVLHREVGSAVGAERFHREIEVVAHLTHPHVLPLHDSGEAGERLYYVMPYVEGDTLRERLEREGPLPVEEVIRILREVADALHHAHERGVVHRDVKPANILLTGGHAMLADFGVARALEAGERPDDRLTDASLMVGTPPYMAPEQAWEGAVGDARSDVYALACVAYEMLIGEPPFTGPTARVVLSRHALDPVRPLGAVRDDVPEGVERAVVRALSKEPRERFATALEFRGALGSAFRRRPPADRRWRRISAAAALAGLAVALGGYAALRGSGAAPSDSSVAAGAVEDDPPVVLADFENHTDDSALAVAVTEALRVDLSQSSVLRLAQPGYLDHVLRRMEREGNGDLDGETAREVAVREGLPAVITGEVNEVGDSYLLLARMVAPGSGEVLASHREATTSGSGVIPAIDRLSDGLRRAIGESLETRRASEPLHEVTTASLDALRLYSRAVRLLSRGGAPGHALELLGDAVRHDSTFAAAYRARGVVYAGMAEETSAMVADVTRAFELRHKLTPRERHMAAGTYHHFVAGDREKAVVEYRRALETAPDHGPAYDQLGLRAFFGFRDWVEAERLFRRGIEVRRYPAFAPYVNLSRALFNQGEFQEAHETVEALDELLPGLPQTARHRADLAAARGDHEEARRHLLGLLQQRSGSEYWSRLAHTQLGRLAHLRGELAEAEARFRRALAGVERAETGSKHLLYGLRWAAVPFWFRGDTARALHRLDSLRSVVPLESVDPLDRPYLPLAGFYAYAGRPAEARRLLTEWERTVPEGRRRVLEGAWRLERAAVSLARHRYREAIAGFERARELHPNPVAVEPQLGRAYQHVGRPDSAVAAYERYLSTPYYLRAFDGASPAGGGDWYWLPVVYQHLAALHEARGETERAARYRRSLADLWKNAAPDLLRRAPGPPAKEKGARR